MRVILVRKGGKPINSIVFDNVGQLVGGGLFAFSVNVGFRVKGGYVREPYLTSASPPSGARADI
jgi:hypothetical protein